MRTQAARRQDTASTDHLLVVGQTRDVAPLAHALHPGLLTSVLCTPEEAHMNGRFDGHARVIVLAADAPGREWVAAGRFIDQCAPVGRVASYSEKSQAAAAAVAADLGLLGHRPETVRAVDDKRIMRERLAQAGVDDTKCATACGVDEVRAFGEAVGFPIICKPVSGAGSRGIVRIDRPQDTESALRTSSAGTGDLDVTELMVEQFHQGTEYSVESVSEHGTHLLLCVTRKFLAPGGFVEIGHQLPAPLPDGVSRRIRSAVAGALDALGVADGVAHTEVIVTDRAVRIVETHLRQGGDCLPYLLRAARGVDLIDAMARQSIGIPALPVLRDRLRSAEREGGERPGYAAIWYSRPRAAGEIVEIRGVKEAMRVPGVREVEARKKIGDRISPGLAASRDRTGYAWAVAESPQSALKAAQEAVSRLEFVVR